jgi:hypothetical protein
LAKSRFGIVIISPDFLKKEWPQRELDGLVAREIDGVKVILPVWHNVTREEILRYSPPLADRLAASSVHGLDKVTSDLMHAIMRPDAAPASTAVTPMPPTPVQVDDLWVSMDYPEKLGITAQLRTDGYELKWERQIDEATSIDIDGWEHVIVDRRDGTRARLKIKDAPIIGGYVVLLKRKKRTGTT